MEEETRQVIERLKNKPKLVCPDCGKILDTVVIERFDHRAFKIDYEYQRLAPASPISSWEFNDWTAHCPYCDSLNIDEQVKKLEFDINEG